MTLGLVFWSSTHDRAVYKDTDMMVLSEDANTRFQKICEQHLQAEELHDEQGEERGRYEYQIIV